jgi:hypothetical protein
MPGPVWFAVLLVGLPLGIYLPTHLLLRAFIRPPAPGPDSAPSVQGSAV